MLLSNNYNEMCNSIASIFTKTIKDSLFQQNKVSLVLCGGKTPKLLYELLSKENFEWQNIVITTCDEYLIESDSIKRPTNLIKDTLLKNSASKAKFYPLETLVDSNINIKGKSFFTSEHFYSPDILLLGLGIQGHTASIFPDAINIEELLYGNEDVFLVQSKLAESQRLTIGLNSLFKAKKIFFIIQGTEKLKILTSSILASNIQTAPVKAFLDNKLDTLFFWCPDDK
ncbi:MAG: 6-phosphogluconolactonase [Rickettsiaceae bacterium]|nr:6-phosphogluconolactonase [Rickettsiaceae bacterium]